MNKTPLLGVLLCAVAFALTSTASALPPDSPPLQFKADHAKPYVVPMVDKPFAPASMVDASHGQTWSLAVHFEAAILTVLVGVTMICIVTAKPKDAQEPDSGFDLLPTEQANAPPA